MDGRRPRERREQFAELFRAEHAGLVRELTLIVGSRALAEEVAADTFAELWRRWAHVGEYDRPGAWVRVVALRKATCVRYRQRRGRAAEEAYVPSAPPAALDIDLVRALGALPHAQRAAVVLHHLGGWPASDIAEILGCSDGTVRTHLHRARRRLAELLGDPVETTEVFDADHS